MTNAAKKTKEVKTVVEKEFKVRVNARMGSMKEIYVEGGGELPKVLSGMYTDVGMAQKAINLYKTTRRDRAGRKKEENG